MIRTLATLTIIAGLSMTGSSYAFNPVLIGKIPPKGQSGQVTSPGDAFYPNADNHDARAECVASGGTPRRIFVDNSFEWTCVH